MSAGGWKEERDGGARLAVGDQKLKVHRLPVVGEKQRLRLSPLTGDSANNIKALNSIIPGQ